MHQLDMDYNDATHNLNIIILYKHVHFVPRSLAFGPAVFGDTSPRFVEAKAATNGPVPDNDWGPFISFSSK